MSKIIFGLSEVLLDKEDVKRVQEARKFYNLEMTSGGYVCLRNKESRRKVLLHRFILELGKYDKTNAVDHINGIKHDNRRSNLRVVDIADNAAHITSTKNGKYRNVYRYRYNKRRGTWNYAVQIQFRKKNYYGGHFATMEEAAKAAVEFRKKVFGHLA